FGRRPLFGLPSNCEPALEHGHDMLVDATPADDLLYCTAAFRVMMSAPLRAPFRNLDELILDVACSAVERLIVVSPYLGTGVIAALRPAVAVSAERGAWIRLVTDVD